MKLHSSIVLELLVRPPKEEYRNDRYRERNEVEEGPADASRDHGSGHQWGNDATDLFHVSFCFMVCSVDIHRRSLA